MTEQEIYNLIIANDTTKYSVDDQELIEKAYLFAKEKHNGKKRKSGEDYITHPLNVALILNKLNVDAITIAAALLHETINHGHATSDELKNQFGEEIANIVQSLSRINKLTLNDTTESAYVYLRKVLVGLSEDVRVLFIKLADRLHNMQTVWALEPAEQRQKAFETTNVLIPIAHRLGINSLKSELEDLCLKYLQPDEYQNILERLDTSREEMNVFLNEMKDNICDILNENNINYKIKARVKSIHSIYEKLAKGRRFDDIYDILALRIIVEKESDCYLAVGLIHAKYRPIPKRFKDYIAMPKNNAYQSLHTTVFGINGYLFEIQIRTQEMDEIAEHGIASHWSYKEKDSQKIQTMMEQKLELFRNLIDANKDNVSDQEFASVLKTEFLSELIYVFTPKGDVVELPKDSTPIDFAYRIHSRIGDTTVGAIVNDSIVPLNYILNDGDIIKINTLSTNKPNKEWLNFVKTSQAKNKIKAYFSKQDKNDYIEKGKYLLEKEIKRRKLTINTTLTDENLKKIYQDLKIGTKEELLLNIGSLRYTSSYILDLINEDKHEIKDILLNRFISKKSETNYKNDIIVAGIDDVKVSLARCCNPIKGDAIKGYITKGNGISIHCSDCPNINNEKDRLINVVWNEEGDNNYITNILIEAEKKPNAMLDIITIASVKKDLIQTITTNEKDNYTMFNVKIKVANLRDLEVFIREVQKLKYIRNITRLK